MGADAAADGVDGQKKPKTATTNYNADDDEGDNGCQLIRHMMQFIDDEQNFGKSETPLNCDKQRRSVRDSESDREGESVI